MPRRILAGLPWAIVIGVACTALGQTAPPRASGGRPVPGHTTEMAPADQPGAAGLNPVIDGAANKRKLDDLLARWEEQSSRIKSLDAKFVRIDQSATWQDKTTYVGRAILKSPDLAFLDFQRLEGKKLEPYEQIRCTGDEVYHYRSATNQIFIYPMPADQRQRALEEGPLPFLFNMRAADAKRRYNMVFRTEDLKYYLLQIQPREQADREAFIRADVALNKTTFMPDVIRLLAPNGKDTQTYDFRGEGAYIRPNQAVNAANFKGVLLEGWAVVRHPEDGKSQSPAVGARDSSRPRQSLLQRPAQTGRQR
jgi:TIGR03009 family protein